MVMVIVSVAYLAQRVSGSDGVDEDKVFAVIEVIKGLVVR